MTADDDEVEAWRRIEARLQQAPRGDAAEDVPAVTPRLAVPRSAGPVRRMAFAMLALALMAAFALEAAYRALVKVTCRRCGPRSSSSFAAGCRSRAGADCGASRLASVALVAKSHRMSRA